MNGANRPVLCLGEALVDVVNRDGEVTEHVGGSLLNVACVIARLGYRCAIGAWWGDDKFGKMISAYAEEHNVEIVPGSDHAERTTVAYATLDENGRASYEFDLLWDVPQLPPADELRHLHVGSIGATLEPGAQKVLQAVKQMAIRGTVSYDPNARPAIMESPELVRDRIESIIALSDLVKASDEDIQWLYPERPVEDVMRHWLSLGAGMVVATRGPWGAYAMLSSERDMLVIDPLNIEMVDTVGAGDSFMGGLISGLLDARLLGGAEAKNALRQARWADVQTALHRATITSGLTVSHSGAYAPTYDDVAQVLAANPKLH
ncbi:carbohydrate kinase family protein [Trueperella sp. LYQ143]|uniref:carbohydrate kinase family protein n=1 Tax=unclassified Trueperella TaxID=2630174 RepID=UPI003983AE8C